MSIIDLTTKQKMISIPAKNLPFSNEYQVNSKVEERLLAMELRITQMENKSLATSLFGMEDVGFYQNVKEKLIEHKEVLTVDDVDSRFRILKKDIDFVLVKVQDLEHLSHLKGSNVEDLPKINADFLMMIMSAMNNIKNLYDVKEQQLQKMVEEMKDNNKKAKIALEVIDEHRRELDFTITRVGACKDLKEFIPEEKDFDLRQLMDISSKDQGKLTTPRKRKIERSLESSFIIEILNDKSDLKNVSKIGTGVQVALNDIVKHQHLNEEAIGDKDAPKLTDPFCEKLIEEFNITRSILYITNPVFRNAIQRFKKKEFDLNELEGISEKARRRELTFRKNIKQCLGMWDYKRDKRNEGNEKDVRYGFMPKPDGTYYQGFSIKVKKNPMVDEEKKKFDLNKWEIIEGENYYEFKAKTERRKQEYMKERGMFRDYDKRENIRKKKKFYEK